MAPIPPLRGAAVVRGRTLVELTLATSATLVVLAAAIPAFLSIADAGDAGRTRTTVESDNRGALVRIARELQNTSLSMVNNAGVPVFGVAADIANPPTMLAAAGLGAPPADGAEGIEDTRTAALPPLAGGDAAGGPDGAVTSSCPACAGGTTSGHSCGLADGEIGSSGMYGETPLHPADSGSGRRGVTRAGRDRGVAGAGSTYGTAANRPRGRTFPSNSILSFQKVAGYSISGSGEPQLTWSPEVRYSVSGRTLLRTQGGVSQPISRNCSCFFVEQTDAGTVVVTIVSQRRAPATGEVTTQSNQIEVRPKN